jgi:hypothetical protein
MVARTGVVRGLISSGLVIFPHQTAHGAAPDPVR